jgi:hypothetical protein
MGQYHVLVNLDKREMVNPHEIGLGAKQYEHTGIEGSLADAMYLLTMSSPANGGGDFPLIENISGRWCGDRVLIVGDYTTEIPGFEDASSLYLLAKTNYVDLSPEIRTAFEKIFDITYEQSSIGTYETWNRVFI